MSRKTNPLDEPPAFTVTQLATRWSTSTNTIGRMIRAGRLTAFDVGIARSRRARYRIAYAEVLRHEAGEAPGGINEEKVAAMVIKPVDRRYSSRRLPRVKEFIK